MDPKIMERLCYETWVENQNAWFDKLRGIFEGDETGSLVLNGIVQRRVSWYNIQNRITSKRPADGSA